MIRFWKTCSWNMHAKTVSFHCKITQIYLCRAPCDFMNPAFPSINNPERGSGEKISREKINSQNCLGLKRQREKNDFHPVLVLPTSRLFLNVFLEFYLIHKNLVLGSSRYPLYMRFRNESSLTDSGGICSCEWKVQRQRIKIQSMCVACIISSLSKFISILSSAYVT